VKFSERLNSQNIYSKLREFSKKLSPETVICRDFLYLENAPVKFDDFLLRAAAAAVRLFLNDAALLIF